MYKLTISEGSGYNDANYIMTMTIPEHGIWPESFVCLRSFKTKEEAEAERERLFRDLIQQMSVIPVV